MARGWESKSVESQQDDAAASVRERAPLTPTEQEILALEGTRRRVLEEIETSFNPRFRELKQKALAHVDGRIRSLRAGAEK